MHLPRALALSLATALIVPAVALAGDTPAPNAERPAGKHGKGDKAGRAGKLSPEERTALRDRVKSKIQTYLTVELSSRAGLDDKKSLQLGNTIKAHMQRKEAGRTVRHDAVKKLRDLVDSKAPDAALKAQMKAVADTAGKDEPMQELLDETGRYLSTTEQAKVMVAFPEVMKDAMHLVREARGGRGGGRGGGGGDLDNDD